MSVPPATAPPPLPHPDFRRSRPDLAYLSRYPGAPAAMSNAVKIFILVNLLFSLGLAYTTMNNYATRENWKRRWDQDTKEFVKEVQARDQALANATLAKVKAEVDLHDRERLITDLQGNVKLQEDKLTAKDQEYQNLRTDLKKADERFAALNENYQTQIKSLELVRSRNAELTHISQVARAVAFNLNVKLSEIEDDLNNAQSELAQRATEIDSLSKENNTNKAELALLQKNHPQIYNELVDQKASTKYYQGVVAAVRNGNDGQQDIVMLTIGKDEKVEEGIEFIVYRDGQYVAKVRTERVMNDMVSARVIPDSWNTKNLKIQQGDQATNRL
jgi:peptidoglycan hydrolase CwlO-like protein